MATTTATAPTAPPHVPDVNDIQGDTVLGLPKRHEDFLFFTITDANKFKRHITKLVPHVTTVADVQKMHAQIREHKQKGAHGLIKLSAINVAFTFNGLKTLGITDSLGDAEFEAGQFAHAQALGDPGTGDGTSFVPDWLPEFKKKDTIHGLLLFAGDSKVTVDASRQTVLAFLEDSIDKILLVEGNVRPGTEQGHEHFGYLDGVSAPAIAALTPPLPGQLVVDPGVLIVGETKDPNVTKRPAWAKNGSFLVYRHLQQLVPEFNKFVHDNPLVEAGPDRKLGSDLFGARLIGRWKSGAPIDLFPTSDNSQVGPDSQKNNAFDFSQPPLDQTRCPFSAHIRKTNPRSDLAQFPGAVAAHAIFRSGIPFGPEVTSHEAHHAKTEVARGLAFVCYQSAIAPGFEFIQKSWVNTESFPPKKNPDGTPLTSGFDPIIGQHGGAPLEVFGTDPKNQGQAISIPNFVKSKGGAYFFSPSISALKTKFSA